jgi:hypothetical protein
MRVSRRVRFHPSTGELGRASAMGVSGDGGGERRCARCPAGIRRVDGGSLARGAFGTGVWTERVFCSKVREQSVVGVLDRGVWINEVKIDNSLATSWGQVAADRRLERWMELQMRVKKHRREGHIYGANPRSDLANVSILNRGHWSTQRDRYCNVCLVIVSLSGTPCGGEN